MGDLKLRAVDYAATGVHLGTSRDNIPHNFIEILVDPTSVSSNRREDLLIPLSAGGRFYTKLYEIAEPAGALPRYFAVAFRYGITDIRTVNLFCHPNPAHAGMPESDYIGLRGAWSPLFRYAQYFGVQLAAARSNIVMVIPMMNNSSWNNLGILQTQWKDIVNLLLVEVQKIAWPDNPGTTMPRNESALENMLLSCFSLGLTVMGALRQAAGMPSLLREVWSFDGKGTQPGPPPKGQAIVYDQGFGGAWNNVFHVPLPRWKKFPFYEKDKLDPLGIHGEIPQRLLLHATTISAFGK